MYATLKQWKGTRHNQTKIEVTTCETGRGKVKPFNCNEI
jgi:hypothetical protein